MNSLVSSCDPETPVHSNIIVDDRSEGPLLEYSSDESKTHDDEHPGGEHWKVGCILFNLLLVVLISRDQEHRHPDDTDDNGESIRTHQFETIGRPSTECNDLELFFMSESEKKRKPRNSKETTVSGVIKLFL